METKEKRVLVPMIGVRHNDDETGLLIEVDLAGASKESVELEMGEAGFCIKGEGEDFKYESCYTLGHEVDSKKTKAKLESGLLRIQVPLKDTMRGHKVRIDH